MRRLTDKNRPAAALACLDEVVEVLRKHGFTLSHEDTQGAFELEERTPQDSDARNPWGDRWLLAAHVCVLEESEKVPR